MPIEVREIIISAQVRDPQNQQGAMRGASTESREPLRGEKDIVDQIIEIFKRKKER